MPEIVETIDISRRPQDVFSFVTDFSLFPRWQGGILSVRREDDGPVSVGSKAVLTRQLGARRLTGTEEITG
jgi:Polyketide cyclase / dehydrase and lipid transport